VQPETTALGQNVSVCTESYIFDCCDYLLGWVKHVSNSYSDSLYYCISFTSALHTVYSRI